VLCFLCSCYALAILYKYHSTDLASCVLAVKFQILFVRLIVVIIPWFIGFYTGYLPKRLLTSISVSAFLIGVLKLALPDSLAFSHLVGIKYLIAPWGEHLTILNCQTDWLTYCIYVVYVFFLIYCFLALRHLLQRRQWMKAWPLMVSLVFAVFVFANDVQVAAGRFHTMYLEEYGFFLYILLVGLWLTSKRIYAESNYRTLFNSVNDGIFVHDARSGMILDVNETAARMFGTTRQDLLTADPVLFMSGQEPYTVERALQKIKQALTEGPQVFEWLSRRLDNGSLFPTEVALHLEVIDNQPVVLAAVRDISLRKKAEEEKKAMEDQMRQAQKLESLGLMAGSVAHDFNNLLGVILGNVQLAKRALPTGAASSHLDQVTDTARRAAALCQQLLAYSGKSVFLIESYDLRQIVTDIARILEVSISKKIRLDLNLPENLPPILADATQVGQVVMNLITNASEAIGGEKGSIALSVTLRNMKRAEFGGFLPEPDLPEGPYVVLEVADTGRGMDDKTVARVFEPFFTTKFPGRGLGMAAV
jgi:PAS domain S-box-containing protein